LPGQQGQQSLHALVPVCTAWFWLLLLLLLLLPGSSPPPRCLCRHILLALHPTHQLRAGSQADSAQLERHPLQAHGGGLRAASCCCGGWGPCCCHARLQMLQAEASIMLVLQQQPLNLQKGCLLSYSATAAAATAWRQQPC
jgi:hypothetical protein